MAPLTPTQQAWRDRFEAALGLAAPALDLLLAAGDRVARFLEPDDAWDPPVRPPSRRAGEPPPETPS
jgi:hypothetical protein